MYTSVIPNLLVDGIVEAIMQSTAKKIYVCNIMTQPGETDAYSVASHVNALLNHAKGQKIIDAVLVNNSLPDNISEGYAKNGSIPVRLDMENIAPIGVEIVSQKLIQENSLILETMRFEIRKVEDGQEVVMFDSSDTLQDIERSVCGNVENEFKNLKAFVDEILKEAEEVKLLSFWQDGDLPKVETEEYVFQDEFKIEDVIYMKYNELLTIFKR